MSAIRMGTGDLAKYPFLNEAGEYVKQSGFSLEELASPEMANILDRAIARVRAGVDGRVFADLDRYEVEILSFLVSLIVVKSIGLEPVVRKFALSEARRAESFLTEDLKKQNDSQRQSLFSRIFEEMLGVRIGVASEDSRLFTVRVTDYLARSSRFHEQEWKLVNRLVAGGLVYLDADETVRLIRHELSIIIHDRIRDMSLPALPEAIRAESEKLRAELLPKYSYRPSVPSDYPPCIKHALDVMAKGENLPHSARVMLATYMLAVGRPIDEIVGLYENAPDYNEKITRYQVEHLAGLKGSRIKYSVPSCEKLLNDNLCYATEQCAGIVSPMQFGRKRVQGS